METSIWRDKWFNSLPIKQQLFYIYLFTNDAICPAGIYEIDVPFIKHQLKIKNIKIEMDKLAPKIVYDDEYGIVWVVNYFRKNQGSRTELLIKSAQNTLDRYANSIIAKKFVEYYKYMNFKDVFKGCPTLCKGFNDNVNVNVNVNVKKKEKKKTVCLIPDLDAECFEFISRCSEKIQKMWLKDYSKGCLKREIKKSYNWYVADGEKKKNIGSFLNGWFSRSSDMQPNDDHLESELSKLLGD